MRFIGANIGGDLDCSGGEFENPNSIALSGGRSTTKGNVFLRNGFNAKGEVSFVGANIGGSLNCSGGEFENPNGNALNGANMKVGVSFRWHDLKKRPLGKLLLENANLANLYDDEDSWPEPGMLNIDGLTYRAFTSHVPRDWNTRLKWLNLRNADDFNVQPYEQLTHVFLQMGLREDARNISIAKQKAIHKNKKGLSRLWSWILDKTISYGYRPEKVITRFILPIILLGVIVFTLAFQKGVMESTATQLPVPGKN